MKLITRNHNYPDIYLSIILERYDSKYQIVLNYYKTLEFLLHNSVYFY